MENNDLKKAGLKATTPRIKILEILEQNIPRHVSAEDVYKALLATGEEVGLATVYRVLQQFETAGLVKRHHFEGGHSLYELHHGDHHDHLMCVKCGRVDEFVDSMIEEQQKIVAQHAGYQMTDHALCIYGVCPQCRLKTDSSG